MKKVAKKIIKLTNKKMETFKINNNLEIVCDWKKTRNGFKHEATLIQDGREIDKTKCCYLNRTWERFTYESVMQKLLEKTNLLTNEKKAEFIERTFKGETAKTDAQFKTIANIAKIGEIFCAGDKKAMNDWKTRMIKAGLGDKGLIMPEDWDQLSEEDKEARLNGVIAQLKK